MSRVPNAEQIADRPRVCVVGAGPHGLIAARAIVSCGLDVDVIERHTDVGGIWDMTNPGTPMYETCHYISSRAVTGYFDFPMPESYPDYPSNAQVLAYIRSFAAAFDLYRHIKFSVAVESAKEHANGQWEVRFSDGRSAVYAGLVCCPGSNWTPRMPELKGAFSGRLMHAVDYRSPAEFAGKRVLVIGLGNSGADIACDAARVGARAMVSVRRGYHIVPKHVFGVPLIDYLHNPDLTPESMRQLSLAEVLNVITGDPSRFGLPKPDHALLESHPLLNTEILHHFGHGRLHAKGPIERLDGGNVHFADGSVEAVDVIVCATGYDHAIPFLDKQLFEWDDGRPQLYLTAFNRAHPTLYAIGLLEAAGVPYAAGDQLAIFIAEYLKDRIINPDRAKRFETLLRNDFPDLKEGVNYVRNNRTANYVNVDVYYREIERVRAHMAYEKLEPGRYASGAMTRAA